MDDATTRATAKVALQILVLASEWPDQDVPISFAQALDISEWKDTNMPGYQAALGGYWTPFVTSAFARLTNQGAVTGTNDEPGKTVTVAVSTDFRGKLAERTEQGGTRIDAIRTALLAAKGHDPDAPGPFVNLARAIGFEP